MPLTIDENEILLDLYTENWHKSNKYIPFNGQFKHFPKTVKDWNAKKEIYSDNYLKEMVLQCEQKEQELKNIIKDTAAVNQISVSDEKPWVNIDFQYDSYQNLKFYVAEFLIDESSLNTLLPDQE